MALACLLQALGLFLAAPLLLGSMPGLALPGVLRAFAGLLLAQRSVMAWSLARPGRRWVGRLQPL